MEVVHEKSCGVIVYNDSNGERKFLLLHYPGGHWDFPKGHVEEGETEKETAQRELAEETDITEFEFIEGFKDFVEYWFMQSGKKIFKHVVFFLAKTSAEQVKISHEHQDSIWLNSEEALERLTFDNAKNLFRKADNFLKSRQ